MGNRLQGARTRDSLQLPPAGTVDSGLRHMKSEQEKPREAESESLIANRREFLGKSLGAVPVVLTVGNRHGWGGNSVHGTLWSSTGTDWKHRGGRWWRGGGWDEPKPPHLSRDGAPHEQAPQQVPPRADWDWQSAREEWQEPQEDWRKWRPETTEPHVAGWDWKSKEQEAAPARDIPVHPIEETLRDKK